jgi:hypothetical protein
LNLEFIDLFVADDCLPQTAFDNIQILLEFSFGDFQVVKDVDDFAVIRIYLSVAVDEDHLVL